MLEPVQRMLELVPFLNDDAPGRGYGDGNTAMANEQAAMYFQGPWAFGEIEKASTDLDLGTFPLPMTDDPDDLKVRVNIDLSLWIPEAATEPEGARELLQFLMRALGLGRGLGDPQRSEEHTSELQSRFDLVCRLLLEKKNTS